MQQGEVAMNMETTFSIIKPNAVRKNVVGKIVERFEAGALTLVGAKFIQLSREKAEGFYIEHKDRPFFDSLIRFMTSGPVLLMALHGEDAIAKCREIMGATDPAEAEDGTIRKDFGDGIEANAVHGSDSNASAERELSYFFEKSEIFLR